MTIYTNSTNVHIMNALLRHGRAAGLLIDTAALLAFLALLVFCVTI